MSTIRIDASERGVDVNSKMIGLFFEDINYGADGGLYGELLENRSFDFFPTKVYPDISPLYAWETLGGATLTSETDSPTNSVNPQYARLCAKAGDGICNKAYDGIALVKGDKYYFSFYARGEALVRITTGHDNSTVFAVTGGWKHYEGILTATESVNDAKLYITLENDASVDIDMCSLFPQKTFRNRRNGLRADMAQALYDMRPGFLRFPGGCIVEGNGLDNRYRWKDTIGDIETRKCNWNRWQNANVGEEYVAHNYFQSYGLGFYEYFLLCEDLECEPLPVLNCGMGCQYQCDETVSGEQLEEYIQDALDLIEFANGSDSSTWGKVRAKMGHKKPFGLTYLAIGNEQWNEKYFERYEKFQKAISEKHPEIRLITSSGPSAAGKEFDNAYEWLRGKDPSFAFMVDEHYYVSADWLLKNTNRYDSYDRSLPKVFAGEYACHISPSQPRPNSLEAAVAEAAMMCGFERNADVVFFASYAPLFARIGYTQWTPDLIFVNGHDLFLTPSYYVQQMFAKNLPTYTLKASVSDDIHASVGFDEKNGEYIVKIANYGNEKTVDIEIAGASVKEAEAQVLTASSKDAVNTMENKSAVIPANVRCDSARTFTAPAYSFSVIRLK
ncbi:MAG: alpha-L-arabinofuranosidase C-terminal domain-containing protein [Clostridia bacterium]|nr:alpha-L-arabinofuranosidase C-terminal domain-containing protein [Clostridia bacterium]